MKTYEELIAEFAKNKQLIANTSLRSNEIRRELCELSPIKVGDKVKCTEVGSWTSGRSAVGFVRVVNHNGEEYSHQVVKIKKDGTPSQISIGLYGQLSYEKVSE